LKHALKTNSNVLENKYCLITGAAGSIGKALSLTLAEKKSNLFLTSKNAKELSKLHKQISMSSPDIEIHYLAGDISNNAFLTKLIKKIYHFFPRVDILINNAGILPVKSLSSSTINDFEKCFNVNVKAPFVLSKEFSKKMILKKWGRIVNIGSSSSYEGFANTSIYCSSKHALLGLSRSISKELTPSNVRVITVAPGSVKSKIGKQVTWENFDDFIEPEEIAIFIVSSLLYNDQMTLDEIRLSRMSRK